MKKLLIVALFGLLGSPGVRAELAPSAYEAMQKAAPERLEIEVLRIEVTPASEPGNRNIHILALVTGVSRSKEGVAIGEVLNIVFQVPEIAPPRSAPAPIPVPAEKEKTVAYLAKKPQSPNFNPVAGSMSFREF